MSEVSGRLQVPGRGRTAGRLRGRHLPGRRLEAHGPSVSRGPCEVFRQSGHGWPVVISGIFYLSNQFKISIYNFEQIDFIRQISNPRPQENCP